MDKQLHFAPLQGYTDFEYRRIHARHCGGVDSYYTPFIRWEKGGVRDKDIKDILPENNEGLHLIPQIICADTDEFNRLADVIQEHGYGEMDLNMGCPAPMQTKLMRGSGILHACGCLAEGNGTKTRSRFLHQNASGVGKH